MILKAQEVYFEPHTSAVHRYEDVTTNDGQQDGTLKVGCLGTRPLGRYLPARRSSHPLHICVRLRRVAQSSPPELSESSLFTSFGSDEHLNDAKLYAEVSGAHDPRNRAHSSTDT